MPTTTEELMQATEKANAFVRGTRKSLDDALAAHIKSVNVSREQLLTMTTQPDFSLYDNALHSKTSLKPEIDPDDDTRTKWMPVPIQSASGVYFYPSEGALTFVYTTFCQTTQPGHYEDPQYSKDVSATNTQFVFANASANSEQINARLEALGRQPQKCGGWWSGTRVYRAEAVRVPDLHPYSRLFMRFVNRGARSGDVPQNVLKYGGNASFAVHKVLQYPNIIL